MQRSKCPVCDGGGKLKALKQVGFRQEEYESECWACRGSGVVWYDDDSEKTKSLKTIVPGDDDVS